MTGGARPAPLGRPARFAVTRVMEPIAVAGRAGSYYRREAPMGRTAHDRLTATASARRNAGHRSARGRFVAPRRRDLRLDRARLRRAPGPGVPRPEARGGRYRGLRPPLRRAATARADQVPPPRIPGSV